MEMQTQPVARARTGLGLSGGGEENGCPAVKSLRKLHMIKKPRSCIISPEVEGPHKNGGVGTHSYYLAAFLSQQLRQDVTLVFTGAIDYKDEAYWQEAFRKELGVQFVW